jgi:predicted enzyme related to lactoylglutathione lyase
MSTSRLRFELFVDDVEVSIRFYQAVLGLTRTATYRSATVR